jgi:hypothetical protein
VLSTLLILEVLINGNVIAKGTFSWGQSKCLRSYVLEYSLKILKIRSSIVVKELAPSRKFSGLIPEEVNDFYQFI